MSKEIPIEISARHLHLCQKDLAILFGKGYKLNKKNNLTQSQFAARETVNIRFGKREIPNVRVVGPLRSRTQLEISLTDTFNLGIKVPIRKSGDLKGTPGILIIGPRNNLALKEGVIVAWRHVHISPAEAKKKGIKNKDLVSVKTKGTRAVTFCHVAVRVRKDYRLSMHLDTDEGNAAGITKKGIGTLIS